MSEVRKRSGFRWNVSRFFLTWPQVEAEDDMPASLIISKSISWLQAKDIKVKWMVACREKHEDGELHYHMGLQAMKSVQSSDPKLFDGLFKKYGNYAKMKGSTKQCVKYLTKAGDYDSYGINVEAVMAKKKAQTADACVEMIKDGKSLADIWDKMPSYVLGCKRKIQECIAFEKSLKRQRVVKQWTGIDFEKFIAEEHNEAERRIAKWLDNNLFKPRDFKQKQLYIWGDTNLGKTTLSNTLQMYTRVYSIPREEDFYDFYDDDRYDVAVLDEFKASKTVQWLNEWLQGAPMVLRAKGFQIEKAQNLPTIILSNYPLEEIYTHVEDNKLETLRGRLLEVHVEKFIEIDIDGLQKEAVVETGEALQGLASVVAEEIMEMNEEEDRSQGDEVEFHGQALPEIPQGEWGTPPRVEPAGAMGETWEEMANELEKQNEEFLKKGELIE